MPHNNVRDISALSNASAVVTAGNPELSISQKAAALGWTRHAVSGLVPGAGGGFHQDFELGSIYWHATAGTHEVHGAIRDKYRLLGGDGGVSLLGYPTTDELSTFDSIGRLNHFERGSIYWHPEIGAFEVHGAIRDKWGSLGWERFGYPTCDEVDTVEKTGRVNHFRVMTPGSDHDERSIYWNPRVGAHAIQGPIRKRWSELGWERSYLGFPTSDQQEKPAQNVPGIPGVDLEELQGAYFNTFERGRIILWRTAGLHEYPDTVTFHYAPNTSLQISGWLELTVDSKGRWMFRGHLRDSGADSYKIGVVVALKVTDKDGKVPSIQLSGSMEGAVEGLAHFRDPHRDHDWDGRGEGQSGESDVIRQKWDDVRSTGAIFSVQFDSALASALGKAAVDALDQLKDVLVGIAIGAGIAIFTALFGGSATKQQRKECGGGGAVLTAEGEQAPPCPAV